MRERVASGFCWGCPWPKCPTVELGPLQPLLRVVVVTDSRGHWSKCQVPGGFCEECAITQGHSVRTLELKRVFPNMSAF